MLLAALLLFTLSGCAIFDPPAISRETLDAFQTGPLADAIAAAKPGVPR